MGEKRRLVYEALVDGATEGLTDKALLAYVLWRCPEASRKKIVQASLLALMDSRLRDRNILHTIYALAIKQRLNDIHDEQDRPSTESLGELAEG